MDFKACNNLSDEEVAKIISEVVSLDIATLLSNSFKDIEGDLTDNPVIESMIANIIENMQVGESAIESILNSIDRNYETDSKQFMIEYMKFGLKTMYINGCLSTYATIKQSFANSIMGLAESAISVKH